MEDFSEETIMILRQDQTDAAKALKLPPFVELDEFKNLAFHLVYPGNGDAPWTTLVKSSDGNELSDVQLIPLLNDRLVIIDPGDDFVDKMRKGKKGDKNTAKDKKKDEEKKKEDDKKKEAKDKEDKEKEAPPSPRGEGHERSKSSRRLSFFRKSKGEDSFESLKLEGPPSPRSTPSPLSSSPSTTELEDEARLYYKGYVKRKGEVKGGKTTMKSWTTLLMVLQGRELLFYKEKKTTRKDAVSIVSLHSSVIEMVPEEENVFRFVPAAGDAFLIEAENKQDLEAWMEYLEEAGCITHQPNGVFGVALEEIQDVDTKGIPKVAIACMQFVEKEGLDLVGIYRLSSTKAKTEELRTVMTAGRYQELDSPGGWDVNAVTGLFKQWLRELPNPLCTFDHYRDFISVGSNPKVSSCREVISKLPHNHRVLLKAVMEHLRRVADKATANKMEASNLGSIFGPSILRPASDHDFRIDKQNFMVEFMIKHAHELF